MDGCTYLLYCRLCGSNRLNKSISLAATPPANELVQRPTTQGVFPLSVMECEVCGHLQLSCTVNPDRLFSNYVYVSGTSPSFVRHFENYANDVINKFNLSPNDLVIDIGSNDGTILKFFKQAGMQVLGIEPAKDIAAQANKDGIETWNEFFTIDTAEKIKKKAKLVVCNNCFAHIDDLEDVVEDIKKILSDDGVFIFEVSYALDMFSNGMFDMIYHEHLHYHKVGSLIPFFSMLDMQLFDVTRVNTHGGSIRCFVSHPNRYNVSKDMKTLLEDEFVAGFQSLLYPRPVGNSVITTLSNKIQKVKAQLTTRLADLKEQGKSIAIYGMPAKATTLLYEFGLDKNIIDFAVDDSPWKQNLLSPGKHIPILPTKALYDRKPDYTLILAWNFAEQIIKNNQKYLHDGGHFIVPLPEIKEV